MTTSSSSDMKMTVNLRNKDFDDKDNIFYSLDQCENIRELDLAYNNITMIPDDLSMFSNLVFLDISNNRLANYHKIGKALATIPRLYELKIDLFSQEDAHSILSQLPHLEYLNDNPTKEDQKPVDVEEKELDFASLKNEIPNFNSILKRMEKKLKGSKETIDFFYSEFERLLKAQIDIINSLDASVPNFIYAATALQSKVEIYSYLQNKALNMLTGQIDYEIIGIVKDINGFIKVNESSTIDIMKKVTPKLEEQTQSDNQVKDELNQKIKALNGKMMTMQKDIEAKDVYIHELSEQNASLITQVNEMKNVIMKTNEINQQRKKEVESLKSNNPPSMGNSQIVEVGNSFNDNVRSIQSMPKQGKVIQLQSQQQPRMQVQQQQQQIQQPSQIYQQKPIMQQQQQKSQQQQIPLRTNQMATPSNQVQSQNDSQAYPMTFPTNNNITTTNNNNTNASNKNIAQQNNTRVGSINGRILSKKTLLETINEIYQSKVIYDKKCYESKLPRETMEQHMYTFLNQKYGLKNLIIEWATGIIKGIKTYSLEDSDVCLFGKILRNEIEENSLAVFAKVKITINEFLTYFLQTQYAYKNKGDIEQMLNKMKTGFLSEDEWINTIEYIFDDPNEKTNLANRISDFIQKGQSRTWNSNNRQGKPITKEEQQMLRQAKETNQILYNDFIQLILDFQIRLRDRYMKNFVKMFRSVDSDMNGIINDEEFYSLVTLFEVYTNEDIDQSVSMLLNQIDPHNSRQMTFSQVVSVLNGEYIFVLDDEKTGGQSIKMSILDRIAMNSDLDTIQ